MKSNHNGLLIEDKSFSVDFLNRSFQYGDGLFETIIIKNGSARLLDYHYERLIKGLDVLGIVHQFSIESIERQINELISTNNLTDARVKFHVWRANGGLFSPTNNEAEYLISAQPINLTKSVIDSCSFSKKSTIYPSATSQFKTNSTLNYVLAGVEKQDRMVQELILLNYEGYIAECISSNIFWFKDNEYFTPSLEVGCVAGVMRKHIISIAEKHNLRINIGKYSKNDILNAQGVFTTNATGCYPIKQINGKNFTTDIPIIPLLGL